MNECGRGKRGDEVRMTGGKESGLYSERMGSLKRVPRRRRTVRGVWWSTHVLKRDGNVETRLLWKSYSEESVFINLTL